MITVPAAVGSDLLAELVQIGTWLLPVALIFAGFRLIRRVLNGVA